MTLHRLKQLESTLHRLRRDVFAHDEQRAERIAGIIPKVRARLTPEWEKLAAVRQVKRDEAFAFRWQ